MLLKILDGLHIDNSLSRMDHLDLYYSLLQRYYPFFSLSHSLSVALAYN